MIKKSGRPIETLTLEFKDGSTRDLKFSAYALFVLDDEFEGFVAVVESAKVKPFLSGAKLLYAGSKAIDNSFTYEDAKKLIVNMSVEDIANILIFMKESMGEKIPQ
jgi:hypothetical protein